MKNFHREGLLLDPWMMILMTQGKTHTKDKNKREASDAKEGNRNTYLYNSF